MTDEERKALVGQLRGHAEMMTRDKGKFVRFIDLADCTQAADQIAADGQRIAELEAENERLRGYMVEIESISYDEFDALGLAHELAAAALGDKG